MKSWACGSQVIMIDDFWNDSTSEIRRKVAEETGIEFADLTEPEGSSHTHPTPHGDAEELVELADTSIIVIRQHWVEAREINDTIDALGGRKRMLGCVFNNASKTSLTGSAAGYGYGYGGQYAE